MKEFLNVDDFQTAARRRLPRIFADNIEGGAFSETTLSRNRSDLQDLRLRQRVLRPVGEPELGVSLRGQGVALPFGPGPVGFMGLYRRNGEIAVAHAAKKAGVPTVLSSFSIAGLQTVASATGAVPDFQLYLDRDPEVNIERLQSARKTGVHRIFFTVDTAVTSVRERDVRNGFRSLERITPRLMWQFMRRPAWMIDVLRGGFPQVDLAAGRPEYGQGALAQARNLASRLEKNLSWDMLRDLRSQWQGELIVKGLMDVNDIRLARDCGVDGIVVSNHGGRQLDHGCSTILKVKDARQAIGSELSLYVDGGFRRGTDIIKAIALGADFVLLGRPFAWAVASGGERGVEHLFSLLTEEIKITMQLMGLHSVAELRELGDEALESYPSAQGYAAI
jgi:isopentenyl diphosphate isomerase/L-lactate dehydrogenase-like FMN-dependent dehydrogenase